MVKKKIIVVILLIVLSVITGYLAGIYILGSKEGGDKNMESKNPPDSSAPPRQETDSIKLQIQQMTVEEKVGQMVIVGVEGDTFNSSIRKMIEDYHVGGFIFMGNSIKGTSQLLKLINDIKAANADNKIPLFLSLDQEGGRVDRMPLDFNRYPTNKSIGKINNDKLSYNIGSAIAHEISSFGFNMDFAPVLDINSNPKNPVIGDRSFGTSSKLVSSLGVETMKGIQEGNVISVVKHFPGHGDTSVDSHIGLPKVNKDLEELLGFEIIPFKEAIKNNADAIMIAHILLPKIDSKYPVSLSRAVINDILRQQLNFKGIVITDDMTMGAISKNYSLGAAAVKSINAGSDIILVAHDYNKAIEVVASITKAVENGDIKMDRIDESTYRVLQLKKKYNIEDKTIKSVNINEINNRISNALDGYFK